jgi:hypothetical protein
MLNILFYGNCQLTAVCETLHLDKDFFQTFSIPCWSTDCGKTEFTDIIEKCDVIITQSINDCYRNVDYLSTSYIINNSKKDCKIIIVDNCYFDFYYFDVSRRQFNNEELKGCVIHSNKKFKIDNNQNKIDTFYIQELYINDKNNKYGGYLFNFIINKCPDNLNEIITKCIYHSGSNIKHYDDYIGLGSPIFDLFVETLEYFIKN